MTIRDPDFILLLYFLLKWEIFEGGPCGLPLGTLQILELKSVNNNPFSDIDNLEKNRP